MKLKKVFLLSVLLIFIFMIGSASAADDSLNTNESISLDESSDMVSSDDDEPVVGNEFNVSINDEQLINSVRFTVNMPKDAENNLTVSVDDVSYRNISSKEVIDNYGWFALDLSNFTIGNHNLAFNYTGNDYTFYKESTINLTLFKAYIPTSIMVNQDDDDMGPSILCDAVNGLEGDITVYIDNKKKTTYSYYEYDIEGYYLGNLAFGNHTIEVRFTNGSYNYHKKVNVTVWYGFNVYAYTVYGEKQHITIDMPYDIGKGKFTVKIDGKSYKYVRDDYSLKITDVNFPMGRHNITITYSGDKKYYPTEYDDYFDVYGIIKMPDTYHYATQVDEISLNIQKDAKGKLCINITRFNGTGYEFYKHVEIPLVNGKATFSFKELPLNEDFDFDCYYDGDDYWVSNGYGIYKIIKPKLSNANDIKMFYYDGTNFKVKVTDSLGNVLEAVFISIKINGKFVKKVCTDENGIAAYKITQTPNKYKITAEIGNVKVTKTLTVKQILSLKKVKVKKYAKKLVLTATLKKVKGKYLKGKKITFKFNGKKYTAKTNKKGVAKVTIKKSALKKLKVGKKVKYQATYIKDTVKRTAKVKR